MDENAIKTLEAEESMFVQTAQGVSHADGRLTLEGVTPSTLYFSDRPERVVGHMRTSEFVDLWGEGENSFEADPPNAVLALLGDGDAQPTDAVVVIKEPREEGGQLSYVFEVLEESIPAHTGPATLFIDPFGRPLSPSRYAGCAAGSAVEWVDAFSEQDRRDPVGA